MVAEGKATFPGYYASLADVAAFIREAAYQAGFDNATIYNIELALDEAVTNIIEHAYGAEGVGEIELAYRTDEAGLTITIQDYGQPFDPEAVQIPDIHASLQERENHGLGVFLIRRLMDEVHFSFSQTRGNSLVLVKYKD